MNISKLICLGDSLTEGYGIDLSKRWTDLLKNELNIKIVNKGISGDTTAGMLARFQTMVVDLKPSHVIIFGGTNDISLGLKNNVILSNIVAMVKLALYHNIKPIIGVPTSCFESKNLKSSNSKLYLSSKKMIKRVQKFQEIIKEFAIDRELEYIDFSKSLTSSDYIEDKIHPNNNGHVKMMINVKDLLKNSI